MFPYIKQIKVNDCNTYQDFNILDKVPKSFKHIIITGKNGSGKTTILNRIGFLLQNAENGQDIEGQKRSIQSQITQNPKNSGVPQLELRLKQYTDVELEFFNASDNISLNPYNFFKTNKGDYIFSFFRAHRKVNLQNVSTVTKETEFINQLKSSTNTENFIHNSNNTS